MSSYLLKGGIIATFDKENKLRTFKSDVLVQGSFISKIEPNISASSEFEVIDCTNKWITPGMVDTHRHVWMTVLRGSHCDWLLSEYLVKTSWHIQRDVTAAEIRIGELAGCLDALQSGVTTILDHFHAANTPEHAEAALGAAIQSGARVVWCPSRQSPPTQLLPSLEYGLDAETSKWQLAKLKEWASRDGGKLSADGRITLGLAYDLVGSGPMSAHKEVLDYARSLPVAIITAHVVKGPRILLWKEGGILGPDVIFAHCNELYDRTSPDDEMWAAMKEHNCAVASTPEDELGMAQGNPTVFEAVERGVKCGLGIDCSSINGGDLFTQMRFALQWKRGRIHEQIAKDRTPPPMHNKFNSADAFRLATLGGAEALNMSDLIGTIEVGKKADLLVFDADSMNLAGIRDPVQGVVFHASNADVELVMVNGEVVKKDGKLTKVAWGPVAKELRENAEHIRARWPDEKLEKAWLEYYEATGGPVFR